MSLLLSLPYPISLFFSLSPYLSYTHTCMHARTRTHTHRGAQVFQFFSPTKSIDLTSASPTTSVSHLLGLRLDGDRTKWTDQSWTGLLLVVILFTPSSPVFACQVEESSGLWDAHLTSESFRLLIKIHVPRFHFKPTKHGSGNLCLIKSRLVHKKEYRTMAKCTRSGNYLPLY